MPADPRSVVAHPLEFVETDLFERGDAQPGDVIMAFLASDFGLSDMKIAGGGTWQPLGSRAGTDWAGAKIWGKAITSGEPTRYTVSQADDATIGVLFLLVIKQATLSNIVIVSANGFVAPAASPGYASGLEIRYGAGASYDEEVSWPQLSGYSGIDLTVFGVMTGSLAVRRYVSSAPVPALNLDPDPDYFLGQAWTILVRSAGSSGGGVPPTPPTFPVSTPGKGESHVRVTVHDFRTGEYVDDITPSGLVLSKFLGEPGSWRGRLDLANRDESAKINRIFPADPQDLLSGPGRLVAHTWLSEVLWGIHWLHTTETVGGEDGNVYMQVMGSTLDAYLLYVALEQAVEWEADQIQNARDLITHLQANPASNPGLGLMAGVSGISRPLTAVPGPGVTYGRIMQDYARVFNGFETVVNPRVIDGSIIRSWEYGAPKIIGAGVHNFEEGEDGGTISGWKETRSALAGGNRWGAWGGTPQQEDATMGASPVRAALVTTPHVAAGHPIIDQRPTHPGNSVDQDEVDNFAKYWAGRAAGAPSVFTFSAIIGPGSTLGPNSLGDQVRATLNNPRYPIKEDGSASFDRSQRLIGWELTPADRAAGGKDKIRLITEEGEA